MILPVRPVARSLKGRMVNPTEFFATRRVCLKGAQRSERYSDGERRRALERMLGLYAAAGLTAVGDRAVTAEEVAVYDSLHRAGQLPVRVVLTWRPDASGPVQDLVRQIRESPWTTNAGDDWLKFGTFKVTLDGGQSVGTAYQRMPYGPFGRQLYGQTDPTSRGTLFVTPEKLYAIYSAARDKGWQLTAHAQGGGAVDTLLDVFERLNRERPIAPTRSHVMHGSFLSREAIQRMKTMGMRV